MSVKRNRRLPVISRLTLAWTAFALAAGGLTIYAAVWGAKALRPEKIALSVDDEIEVLARPESLTPFMRSVLTAQSTGERLEPASAPLREGEIAEPFYAEAEDALQYGPGVAPVADALGAVITIDGEPVREAGEAALRPQLASLAADRMTFAIPDADPALLQKTPLGRIPKISSDGRRAMKAYARPFQGAKEAPKVALIVGGLGLNPELTARAIEELPADVTLAFAPYAKDLEIWTADARAAGHEIMIELPMEGYAGGVEALGPAALLTSRSEAENLQRLDWLLSRFGGYVGATNYVGGKFSANRNALGAVVKRLDALGLAYVDDTGAAKHAAGEQRNWTSVNRMIAAGGPEEDAADVARDLAALTKQAGQNGDALGKAFAYEAVIDAVIEWSSELEESGVALAPASAVLRARAGRG